MNDDLKETVDRLANALQTVVLLAARLRQQLGEAAQDAADLENATDRAVRAVSHVRPKPPGTD